MAYMGLEILTKDGKVDKVKTNKLKRLMVSTCKKITKVMHEELTKFHKSYEGENLDPGFSIAASHQAMLILSQNDIEVFLSAEIADLFGDADIANPKTFNQYIDIKRIQKAKEKYDKKLTEKEPKD